MRKTLVLLLIVISVVVSLETGYIIYLTKKKSDLTSRNILTTQGELEILYKSENDKDGSTILYTDNFAWGGIGFNVRGPWAYISGLFDSWTDIEGTQDKYISIKDPLTKDIIQQIRIVHSSSQLISQGIATKPTRLQIEHLNNYSENKDEISTVGQVLSENQDVKDYLPKKGDAILVFFPFNKTEINNIPKDDNGYYIAYYLTVKRYYW